jgi:hypothetical protein
MGNKLETVLMHSDIAQRAKAKLWNPGFFSPAQSALICSVGFALAVDAARE